MIRGCFKLKVKSSVKKDTRDINKEDFQKISDDIKALKINPFPTGVKKIKRGKKTFYRIRQGKYRIGYLVYIKKKIIEVLFVRRRKESTYKR